MNGRNKSSTGRLRKFGLKDENIDRQIQVLHLAIAEKLIADTQHGGQLIEQVQKTIETRIENGQLRYGDGLFWLSLIDNIADREQFRSQMTEYSTIMRKRRRQTPFVGILTEEERQQALSAHACGVIPLVFN